MKKGGILNPPICALLAELGQGDELMIVDASFPLPEPHIIDLSLVPGIPRFIDVFKAILAELVVDSLVVANEIQDFNGKLLQEIGRLAGPGVDVDPVPHHELKEQAADAKGIIRTGEFTPYANVKIVCGSAF